MRISVQDNTSSSNNFGFKSLISLKYKKNNPRLAKAVLEIKNSKAFQNLFTDSRFDCFVKLKSTKYRMGDELGHYSRLVPAERFEINIVSKEGKSNFINNMKDYFYNCRKRFWTKYSGLTSFTNDFDEKKIGTLFFCDVNLFQKISELKENKLVSMVDDMIAERDTSLVSSNRNKKCIEEASKAAKEMLNKS